MIVLLLYVLSLAFLLSDDDNSFFVDLGNRVLYT